jgi:hypothetical protein
MTGALGDRIDEPAVVRRAEPEQCPVRAITGQYQMQAECRRCTHGACSRPETWPAVCRPAPRDQLAAFAAWPQLLRDALSISGRALRAIGGLSRRHRGDSRSAPARIRQLFRSVPRSGAARTPIGLLSVGDSPSCGASLRCPPVAEDPHPRRALRCLHPVEFPRSIKPLGVPGLTGQSRRRETQLAHGDEQAPGRMYSSQSPVVWGLLIP